jgi:hypothetical protein
MGWWALLLCGALALDANKAVLCLALAKFRLAQSGEYIDSCLQSRELTYNDVFAHLLTELTLTCYSFIESEDFLEALELDNAQMLRPRMQELVPLPEKPLLSAEDIKVSESHQQLFISLVSRVKADYQRTDNSGLQVR